MIAAVAAVASVTVAGAVSVDVAAPCVKVQRVLCSSPARLGGSGAWGHGGSSGAQCGAVGARVRFCSVLVPQSMPVANRRF